MTFIDLLPMLILTVLVPFSIAGFFYYRFLKRKNQEESEQEEIFSEDIIEMPCDEPPLTEIRATVLRMRCEVNTYGTKTPHCHEEYFITFADEYENELTYSVDKDTYLTLSEGQKGTIAIVNDRFYGFAED